LYGEPVHTILRTAVVVACQEGLVLVLLVLLLLLMLPITAI
jgi:hypothetical protein